MSKQSITPSLNQVSTKSKTWNLTYIQQAAEELRQAHPREIIEWGVNNVGVDSITLASSFGYEDVALVDLVTKVNPDIDIFYLDTDLLFKETYQVRDQLSEKYKRNFIRVTPSLSLEEQAKSYGDELWSRNPNECCAIRKVEPLKRFLEGYEGWITGIRREQSPTRAHTEVVEWDAAFGLVKLNPLAFWTTEQVWEYIREHQIPYNPLHDQNYPSIGCWPCTRAVRPGEDPCAGRWAGTSKTECGLHNSPVQR
jgi:phosphoadenosine phosphosulfate reductase